MFEHIEKLKAKPTHIREQIAFGIAAGTTTLVFAGWLAVMTATNAFSAAPTQYAATNEAAPQTVFSQTASSFSTFFGDTSNTQPASIVVEDQSATTTDTAPPTQISF